MKKFISVFTAIIILLCPLISFAQIGAEPPTVYAEFDGDFFEGNTITCNVYIKNNPGFATMVYEVWFEKGKLEPVMGSLRKSNNVFAGGSAATNIDPNAGNNVEDLEFVKFVWVKPSNCRALDGLLYSFDLKVLSNDASIESLDEKLVSMHNSNGRSLLYSKGDTDADEKISAHDLVIFLHPKEYRDITAGDIDDSGITDKTDFNLLGEHIVNNLNNFSCAEKIASTSIKPAEFISYKNGYKVPIKVTGEMNAAELVIEYNSSKLEFVSCESDFGSVFTKNVQGRLNLVFARHNLYNFENDTMVYLCFEKKETPYASDLIIKDAAFFADSGKVMAFEDVLGINFSISNVIFADGNLDFDINSSLTKGLVIVAVYDGDDRFLKLEYHNALEVLPVSLKNIKAGNKIKVFWWESLLGNPVTEEKEYIID